MQRPAALTALGVLNIVFGALGLLAIPMTIFSLYLTQALSVPNPMLRVLSRNSFLQLWTVGSLGLGAIAGVVAIASGIGLLRLKPWARTASLVYAVYGIISVVAGAIVNATILMPAMLQEAQGTPGPAGAGAAGGVIGGVVGSFVGLIYPIVLLVLLTRPHIVAAFNSASDADKPQP